tara:strand:- start:23524 stop:23697 length:174 start_codon:yes stop_codon:yes gene_type:complete
MNIETVKTLLAYLEGSPMSNQVMSIVGGVAVIKFNLDEEYTYRVTQKGLDEWEKNNE